MMMIPSWATVLWVGAMALGLGILIGRLQVLQNLNKAEKKIRTQIGVTGPSRAYSRDEVRELLDQISSNSHGRDGADR